MLGKRKHLHASKRILALCCTSNVYNSDDLSKEIQQSANSSNVRPCRRKWLSHLVKGLAEIGGRFECKADLTLPQLTVAHEHFTMGLKQVEEMSRYQKYELFSISCFCNVFTELIKQVTEVTAASNVHVHAAAAATSPSLLGKRDRAMVDELLEDVEQQTTDNAFSFATALEFLHQQNQLLDKIKHKCAAQTEYIAIMEVTRTAETLDNQYKEKFVQMKRLCM